MPILVIEDTLADFALLRASLRLLPVEPWTDQIELRHSMSQLVDSSGYGEYAGVVVDLHLPGKSGVSVAADICRATNMMVPVLLCTGEDKTNIPFSVRAFVDNVAFKNDHGGEDSPYLWSLRKFFRDCWRLHQAKQRA